jgi:hypothetical protein
MWGGGVEVCLHSFSTSALEGGEWTASRPCRFTRVKGTPGVHCVGGWLGTRTGLHVLKREKSVVRAGIRTPDRPSLSLVAIPTRL